jgi:uncharacterized repeat protein (TIGR03847 family)
VTDVADFAVPDRFSVGTSGPVGQRVFLLHAAEGAESFTVKVEKQQVAVLAGYMARVVREQGRPGKLPEDLDFDTAVEPEWAVATIAVSYDEELERVVVVLEETGLADEEDEDEGVDPITETDEGRVARVAVTKEQAAAFAIRTTTLVEAGRPPCPLCGLPLDPSGHDCPRTNGHRPPVT